MERGGREDISKETKEGFSMNKFGKGYFSKYYETHREWLLGQHKKYYQKHKEERQGYSRKYYRDHRKQRKEYSMKHHQELKLKVFEKLGRKCSNPFNLPHPDWCNDFRCL